MKRIITGLTLLCVHTALPAQTAFETAKDMQKKILFVVTSHDKLGDTGQPTGYTLEEVTHPWKVLTDAGYEIDIVSPKGGRAPVDGIDLSDPVNKQVWESQAYQAKINHTMKPSQVDPRDYPAIFFAGGHGTMWDFPDNAELQAIARQIYENGGIVSAVCHGPAALVNLRTGDGKLLVEGRRVNSFTDEEERAVKKDGIVPFLLETRLRELGADFEGSGVWQVHVTNDRRLITGQNPQSAGPVAAEILKELER